MEKVGLFIDLFVVVNVFLVCFDFDICDVILVLRFCFVIGIFVYKIIKKILIK